MSFFIDFPLNFLKFLYFLTGTQIMVHQQQMKEIEHYIRNQLVVI